MANQSLILIFSTDIVAWKLFDIRFQGNLRKDSFMDT